MASNPPNPKVTPVLNQAKPWREEMLALRALALASGLTEDLKWGQACYSSDGKNVFLIHAFKEYCALLFMKGALMKDPKGILIQQTENVQSARQIRFTSLGQIVKMKPVLRAYLREAIAVEKSGAKVEMKKTAEFKMPDELREALDKKPALKKAFETLTPGRQRGYLLHFAAAKQAKTREARIEKCTPKILKGKGLLE
jgi:uncharacterized protein YdeI (YjbR/CyaY-like superfamily)